MSTGTTVVVLIAAPSGLRGHPTRWFVEVAAGVYVGNPNSRIRERLWSILAERIHDGQTLMIEPATTQQGWSARRRPRPPNPRRLRRSYPHRPTTPERRALAACEQGEAKWKDHLTTPRVTKSRPRARGGSSTLDAMAPTMAPSSPRPRG
ncbi:type I-E CRISPR-associated endoribonuclease Cas2e [Streptomyces indiaensis]|uniref:type I-E CRISPR-associated endoribonuclease Cas2e n=1 Tax=Streptomyces indiaensis TaxID=284033 RepID=UPI001F31D4AB|nr:type I-E CRISPR-associated endoribonuclease Cas2e [Streptomyces indiaensis]MCF1649230.1 type I-E CRISPR-associated endoribonuclease Cas2e [Streptomyces indiaensis]